MEIDAELRRQITVSLAAAAVFIVGLVGIGVTFGGSAGLPASGALALVGLLAGFVLLMALVGAYLIRASDEA
ncbi:MULTISPECIES: hypothetical protein [unclassified Halorubrum]|uniref:DUF7472 family protein n=1 Tax=unclassified Halorubrum TaxID=2642239 RepID=UPI000B995847|nr:MULTISPECIES: hypothetical protein [unclassified Halorubrum]OYR39549.1 hypothetical protein DJ81_15970 [Halorubrum sp. Hd13]OYR40978.1 hypothetical protein DJ75_14460 [Halorubrum sp. Eb13]OYR49689.1 hypothetical protein DJ74_07760 [Halorubrum sp. Ea8]OYR51497.1 hypothetical protein DJ73_12930 [Halorubrum sp. Ea1]